MMHSDVTSKKWYISCNNAREECHKNALNSLPNADRDIPGEKKKVQYV